MTPQEKAGFRDFAYRRGGGQESVYVRFFDCVAGQKWYDEAAVKRIFIGEKWLRRFTYEKVRLYRLVLKSLAYFHRDAGKVLADELLQCRLLHLKGLNRQSHKLLMRVKREALRSERTELLPAILDLERSVSAGILPRERYLTLSGMLAGEHRRALQHLDEISRCRHLSSIIHAYGSAEGFPRSPGGVGKIKKALAARAGAGLVFFPGIGKKIPASATARFYYHTAHGSYYKLTGMPARSLRHCREAVDIMEALLESDPCGREDIRKYIAALNNLILAELQAGQYNETGVTLGRLRSVPGRYPFLAEEDISSITGFTAVMETNRMIMAGEFGTGAEKIPAIFETIGKGEESSFAREVLGVIYMNFSYLCLGAGRYAESLEWLNRVILHGRQLVREDLYATALLMGIILHYELGHTDLLEYLSRSAYRFLAKRERLYKTEDAILAFIRNKLPKITNDKALMENLKTLKTSLEKIARDPYEKKAMENFDFISWLESKISQRPFAEIVREKAGKKLGVRS